MATGRVITAPGSTGVDISDADATVGNVLTGKTFYATSGGKKTGTMPNSTGDGIIYEASDEVGIPAGYHAGTGIVKIDPTEQAKFIPGNIRAGVTVLGVSGDSDVVDTSDANAAAGDILSGKSGYVAGSKVNGSMTDRGTVSTDITTKSQEVTIAAGKHSGSGVVKIDSAEQAKIIAANIKSGVTLLGVAGNLSSGAGSMVIREYISSATWTKPAGLIALWVVCVGAGGGGGSGRRGAAGTVRGGPSSGCGGAINIRVLTPGQLSASHSITIGTGGTGGAARTTNDTNGANGSAGGNTTFGTLVTGKGGNYGFGGSTTAAGVQGNAQVYEGKPLMGMVSGGAAQGNIAAAGGSNVGSFHAYTGAGGGAGGGCISSANVAYAGGNVDGGKLINGSTISTRNGGGAGTGINGTDGSDDICFQVLPQLDSNVLSLTRGIGDGGGAGGGSGNAAGTVAGGRGGHGGRCCGGAGGGSSTNGANSGAGGNGGNGLCIVVEFY